MTHYVCTGGCGGTSDTPGTCQTKDCLKYHQPLTACNCEDGAHQEALVNPNRVSDGETTHTA